MKIEEFKRYQEDTFDAFVKKVAKNEGRNARRDISRREKNIISLSQLETEENSGTYLASEDTYEADTVSFTVCGESVTVKDQALGRAIASLPPKKRDLILLFYFLDENDPEISELLEIKSRTVNYRRRSAVDKLKEILEGIGYEF